MDIFDFVAKFIMLTCTVTLFLYGLLKGYDTIELILNNAYFIALIAYLVKVNFLEE